jgi:serine protease AprX
MRRKLVGAAAALALVPVVLVTSGWGAFGAKSSQWQEKVEPSVLAAAQAGETEFFVYLAQKADLSGASSLGFYEKSRFVYERLNAVARSSQAPVIAELDRVGATYRSFWVANSIVAKGDLSAIEAVAALPAVQHVYPVESSPFDRPVRSTASAAPDAAAGAERISAAEENIAHVNADQVWTLGYTGVGAVVAGADTGVRWDHAALKPHYRGWNGTTADHNYNWHDGIDNPNAECPGNSPAPCDDDFLNGGHGTHTMGTMVGDDGTPANQIGMAPGAKWIACRNMNNGVGVIPTYMDCMQWFIMPTNLADQNPDETKKPHVVNNSWGCVEVCPPPALQDTLQASREAGIFYAVSAGNDGQRPAPSCGTVHHPLARYPESFTVGATVDPSDEIADFSSTGPVLLGDPPNQTLLLKPNVTAPGVNVKSSVRDGTYEENGWSGTSMAGPHVAGLVALLIDANPSLAGEVDELEDIIEETAKDIASTEGCPGDQPPPGPNNVFGHGRIDALAAVQEALGPTAVRLVSFRASKSARGVRVTWRTGSYIGAIGFNVWRSTKANGRYTKLNRTLLESKTRSAPASYSYLDRSARRGKEYFYKLQLVAAAGPAVWAGPARAGAAR